MVSRSNYSKSALTHRLFFGFSVKGLLFTPLTILLELNFALNFLAVFTAPIVDPLAIFAGQFD